ncbi:glycosyl hydrolase family 79 C-terminal domain-containing protein [Dyella acidiphila]|uniref:Beta-glucuronidase C-terminal domain-containing protein n=1 Tax=Dyella acidiphila TaxID=2775866 RepID=A0ABR9GES1_9GAMM|nr:glycosyl hydrolase family 79 C-terminal domain-containing protein [Dyella acidiphila]MBE1162539.1 hypothetical protein [Dyella acidiphila]
MLKATRSALFIVLLCAGTMAESRAQSDINPPQASNLLATVKIDPNAAQKSIAPSFLGLSMVLSETRYTIGTSSSSNPYFQQLLQNLLAHGNGPMEIRVLSDKAFSPTTVSDDLPALSNLYRDMQTTGHAVKYFVGVDFSGNSDTNDNEDGAAASEAETIHRILPDGSLLSYEIGNEPDLYNTSGIRSGYNYPKYKHEYEQTAAAIEAKHTGVPMAAPVFSGYPGGFMDNVDGFILAEHAHLGMLDLHYYGGSHCNGKTTPSDYLLSSEAINHITSTARPDNVAGYIRTLNQVGRGNFRIGEMNSIACGGQDGVSNTFQSALWFLDEAMSYASAGVSGVNLFTIQNASAYYSPFRFNHTGNFPSSHYGIAQINPIYYGILAAADMLQSKAAMLPLKLSTPLNIKAYATKDEHGVVRVLLINKEETASGDGDIALYLPGRDDAVVSALRATNNDYRVSDYTHYTTHDEITFAGQTFKVTEGPQDGHLHGIAERITVRPIDGLYRIPLAHASAAVVEIHRDNSLGAEGEKAGQ